MAIRTDGYMFWWLYVLMAICTDGYTYWWLYVLMAIRTDGYTCTYWWLYMYVLMAICIDCYTYYVLMGIRTRYRYISYRENGKEGRERGVLGSSLPEIWKLWCHSYLNSHNRVHYTTKYSISIGFIVQNFYKTLPGAPADTRMYVPFAHIYIPPSLQGKSCIWSFALGFSELPILLVGHPFLPACLSLNFWLVIKI